METIKPIACILVGVFLTLGILLYAKHHTHIDREQSPYEYHMNVDTSGADIYTNYGQHIGRVKWSNNVELDSIISMDNL